MWKPEKHFGTLSVVKKVRVDWDPLFLLLFLLFEAFVLLYTPHVLQNDSCVATALCHMQEQLWVFLSRPLYMIHYTLGKKGVLCLRTNGWERSANNLPASSPVEAADPVLCNLYLNLETKTFLLSPFRICAFPHSHCRRCTSVCVWGCTCVHGCLPTCQFHAKP